MSKLIKVGILISGKVSGSVKRSADTAVQSQGRVGSAIQKVNTQFGQAREARKYGRLLADLKKKQKDLGYSSERLDRGIEDVEQRYNEARRAASRYGSEIGEVERETRRLGDTQRRNKSGLSKAQVGTAVATAGAAALGAGVLGAGNREEAGFYLGTVINSRDGDRKAAVQRSRIGARNFARNSLADEREIIEIEYALNSAGLEEEVSRAGARMAHKVAKITKGESAQVAEIIGTTFNNLGNQMEGTAEEKMARIGNILTKTQFKYQIRDFGQLGASMEYGLATAASYKIGLDQTAASIGFLNSAGFQGSRAGTTFGAMMRSMTKASDELEFSMVRNTDGSLNFIATVSALGESLDGLGTDEKADLIGKIFGDEGKGGVIAMLNDLERLQSGFDEVSASANSGLVDKTYNDALALSVSQWRMLRQNIGQTAVAIGTSLLPVVNAVLAPVGVFMGWVAWGIEHIPGVGLALGLVGAALVVFASYLVVATTATWALNTAMKVTTGRRFLGMLGKANKGLIGMALRAAPAALGGILRLGKRGASGLLGLARNALPMVGRGLKALSVLARLNPIGLAVSGAAFAAGLVVKNWGRVKGFFKGVWGGIRGGASKAWNSVKSGVGSAWGWVKKKMGWDPAKTVAMSWGALTGIVGGMMSKVKGIVGSGMSALKSGLASVWDKIKGIGSAIKDTVTGTHTVRFDAFVDMPGGLMNAETVRGLVATASQGAQTADLRPNIKPPAAPAAAAPQQITKRDGDMVFHINGVVDGEAFMRQIRPAMEQYQQERREAALHD